MHERLLTNMNGNMEKSDFMGKNKTDFLIPNTFSYSLNSMQFYGKFRLEVRNEAHNNLDMIKFCSDSLENAESTYTVVKNYLSPPLCDCTELDKYYEAYSAETIFQSRCT